MIDWNRIGNIEHNERVQNNTRNANNKNSNGFINGLRQALHSGVDTVEAQVKQYTASSNAEQTPAHSENAQRSLT